MTNKKEKKLCIDLNFIIPMSLIIIGFFGIFWVLILANANININLNMDNNTLSAIKTINSSYYETIQTNNMFKGNGTLKLPPTSSVYSNFSLASNLNMNFTPTVYFNCYYKDSQKIIFKYENRQINTTFKELCERMK